MNADFKMYGSSGKWNMDFSVYQTSVCTFSTCKVMSRSLDYANWIVAACRYTLLSWEYLREKLT